MEVDVVPVLESGVVTYYDSKTGEVVPQVKNSNRLVERYDPKKARMVVSLIAEGLPRDEVLKNLGISKHTYLHWQRSEPIFSNSLDEARTLRASGVHDDFYENEIIPLSSLKVSDMSPEDAKNYLHTLKSIQKKQDIISKFKSEDSPERFNTKFNQITGSISNDIDFKITIPEDVLGSVKGRFTPKVMPDGDIVLGECEEA